MTINDDFTHTMNDSTLPVKNIRTVKALVGDAPPSFEELAEAARLTYSEEPAEWGTRFVINFADLSHADVSHPLVQQLVGIAAESHHLEFGQIWLETI